jgi:hypothetical protein
MTFDRIATALSMFAAGPLILAGMLTGVWEEGDTTAAYLETYLVDPGRSQLSALLLHAGYLLLLPCVLGLAMVTRDAPRLRAFGLSFGILSLSTLPGLLIIDFYDLALAQTIPIEDGAAVLDRVGEYPGLLLMFLPTMAGLVLSFALLALAAWRVRFTPWWSSALLFLGLTSLVVVRGAPLPLVVAEAAALTLGLWDVARRLLTAPPSATADRDPARVSGGAAVSAR